MAADQRLKRGVLRCGEKSGAVNSLNDRSLPAFVQIDDEADLMDGAIRTTARWPAVALQEVFVRCLPQSFIS
jgi:hypothetical protein